MARSTREQRAQARQRSAARIEAIKREEEKLAEFLAHVAVFDEASRNVGKGIAELRELGFKAKDIEAESGFTWAEQKRHLTAYEESVTSDAADSDSGSGEDDADSQDAAENQGNSASADSPTVPAHAV